MWSKVHSNIAPDITNDIFEKKKKYHITSGTIYPKKIKSVYYGSETTLYLGPKIWNLVPKSIKDSANVNNFKSKNTFWEPESYPCQL